LTNLNNRRETFDHVARWLKAAMEVAPANLTTILIGNKCDLSDRRTVSYEEGESFAKTHGLFFMESSAKTSHNVEEVMFYPLCFWYNCIFVPLRKKENTCRGAGIHYGC